METYLFKFSACLAIFWFVYVLILERQKMHHIKRFYLLGAFAAALIIPLLTITHYVEPTIATDFEVSPLFIEIEPYFIEIPQEQTPFWDLETVLWFVYGLGALLFGLRFIMNLRNMYRRISNNESVVKGSFIYVLLQDYRIPHSFFKYLFFNKSIYESNTIPKEVQLHEETHAKQLHSLDIIIIELLQIVFWFHPLIYMLKHHIKLNHEFLADEAVINKGIDTKNYQNILLQFSSNAQEHQLSSAINYSSIKKRFTVMKTQTSKTRIWISSLLLLPIIAILFYTFSTKEYIEKDNSDIIGAIEAELIEANALQMEFVDGASFKLMQEYREFMAKFKDTNMIIGEKYERAKIIYDDLMSEVQRNSADKYPEHRFPLRSLSKVEPKKPTSSQFESWKDGDKFAIWIDSKPVKNSELNKYNVNDIVHFMGSKIYKNARSAKYPQPFQFNLYTKSGFQKTYKEADSAKYHKLTERYSKAIGTYLKGSQTDNSELKILKAKADKLYQSFTKQEFEKYNISPAPPVPATQNKPKEILNISLNKTGELFVDGKQGDLQSLENTLKNLKIPSDYTFNFDLVEEAPFKKTTEVLKLLKTYNLVGNTNSNNQQQKVTKKELAEYNAWAKKIYSESKVLSSNAAFYPPINKQYLIKFSAIHERMSPQQKNQSIEFPFSGLEVKDSEYSFPLAPAIKQQIATKKQIAEYNAWAKKLNIAMAKANSDVNAYPIIKRKDVEKYKYTYNIMSVEQKKMSEAFPKSPPPPPRPSKPSTKGKTIKPVEIVIDKNNRLSLNGKSIEFEDLAITVGKLNEHFTIDERRKYIDASIILENNKSLTFAEIVQKELRKVEIYSAYIGYNENINKSGLSMKHVNLYSDLSVEEAKAKQEESLKDNNADSKPKKTSPWAISVGVNKVEYFDASTIKTGPIEINGATYYFEQKNGKTVYYDRYGEVVDINKIPPPPPIPNDATPEQKAKMKKATDAYMKANPNKVGQFETEDGEVFNVIEVPEDLQGSVNINRETYYYTTSNGKTKYHNRYGTEVKMDNLPPPPPATMDSELMETIYETPNPKDKTLKQTLEDYKKWKSNNEPTLIKEEKKLTQNQTNKNPSFLEFITEMEQKGATFYMDGKKISAEQAKTITKNNKGKNTEMITQKDADGKYIVKLSKRSKKNKLQRYLLPMVNGKALQTGVLPMTLNQLKNLELTLPNSKITSFKLKIPGIKTQQIKGNTINKDTLLNLNSIKIGDSISIFDIKHNNDSKISPVIIELIE
jgi:biopolymer transport protein ExbD